jgi:serine phosphatase RsbU (regulator of sigma subunit)
MSSTIETSHAELYAKEDIARREMNVEKILNYIRFTVFLFLALVQLISSPQSDSFLPVFANSIHAIWLFLILLPLMIFIQVIISKRHSYYLKFVTTIIDFTLVFYIAMVVLTKTEVDTGFTNEKFALFISSVFILFSSLVAVKLNRYIIIIAASLSIIFNIIQYSTINAFLPLGLITSVLIFLLSLFNLWGLAYVKKYFHTNEKLNIAVENLQNINNSINQKNEEITAQRDELTRQAKSREEAITELNDSIQYAQKIQGAMINQKSLLDASLKNYFILFQPKEIVSGDFYWVHSTGEKTILVLSDCTGHGVPGAFMTMLGSSFLNEIVGTQNITEPNEILNELRYHIIKSLHQKGKLYESKDGMDVSVVQIDRKEKKLRFSGANNSFFYIPHLDDIEKKGVYEFKGDRMPVSFHYKMYSFSQIEMSYTPGDIIYLSTDGYVDQFGGKRGKRFKTIPFKRLVLENHYKSFEEQKTILEDTFNNWIGRKYEQIDDVTVLGFEL